jgi:hypothetical protein
MDIRKYQLNILCLLLFPLSAAGQEWSKQDSLRLQQMLESDQEIKINRKLIEKVEQKMYFRKPFVDFDPTLPTLKSSTIFSKPSIHPYKMFQKPGSTFLPTYSWLRINNICSSRNIFNNSRLRQVSSIYIGSFNLPIISISKAKWNINYLPNGLLTYMVHKTSIPEDTEGSPPKWNQPNWEVMSFSK